MTTASAIPRCSVLKIERQEMLRVLHEERQRLPSAGTYLDAAGSSDWAAYCECLVLQWQNLDFPIRKSMSGTPGWTVRSVGFSHLSCCVAASLGQVPSWCRIIHVRQGEGRDTNTNQNVRKKSAASFFDRGITMLARWSRKVMGSPSLKNFLVSQS